jgi:molybdopterin/thiamine biosynthesis adenylyltransferase
MKKYILAPYINIGFSGKELKVGFGSIQYPILDKNMQTLVIDALDFFRQPRKDKEFKSYILLEKKLNLSDYYELSSLLIEKKFIIESNIYRKKDRYSRHALFYEMSKGNSKKIQKTLAKKHVVILGCGGIGNIIAINLATAGIGKLTLIDDDIIELSNLTRQIMFEEQEVGKFKAVTLKEQIKKRASKVEIEIINDCINNTDKHYLIPHNDLLVLSGDSNNICNEINRYSYKSSVPFINVGYIQDIAVFGPFIIPGKTACFECFSKFNISDKNLNNSDLEAKIGSINKNYQAPSIGAVNMLAASLASLDILKYLGNFGVIQSLNTRVGVWTDSLRIQFQNYESIHGCLICSNEGRK